MPQSRPSRKFTESERATTRDERSPASASDRAERWRELGRKSLLAGDAAEALWYLRRAVEDDTEHPVAWWLLGECFEQLGDALRAARCFKVASREGMKHGMDETDFKTRMNSATRGRLRFDA